MFIKRSIILFFSIIIIFSCQENDKKEEINISHEIAGLNSISEKEKFLEKIYTADQGIRNGESTELLHKYGKDSKELQEFYQKMISIDKLNLKRIDLYLNEFDYPDRESFSQKANSAPWLVIHHSTDIQTRNKYFKILREAYHGNAINSDQFELYLGRTYQMEFGKYPTQNGPYQPDDKINRLIKELNLE